MSTRTTEQRSAIRAAVERADRPLTPGEILETARERVPRLGLATVYRNVRRLLDDGWLRQVELPGGPARYERAGKGHHHHFVCRACDAAFDLEGCPGVRGLAPEGFVPEAHEIVVWGLCDRCAVG